MKKILMFLLLFASLIITGCTKEETKIKVLVPSGTPLMAIGGLLDDEEYQIEVVSGADLLTAGMTSSSHDVIIAPVTAGTKAYVAGGSKYQIASIITLANNYVVSKSTTTLETINDLNGQSILAYGANNVPDIVLRAALEKSNVTAEITYQNGVNDVIPYFMCNGDSCTEAKYILTTEPALTTLQIKQKQTLNIVDLQEVLSDELTNIPQAAVFVNPDANKKAIDKFLDALEKNIKNMNDNPSEYANDVLSLNAFFTNLGVEVLSTSIPRSNITYLEAKTNKTALTDYYNLIDKYNSKLLNGARPDEAFYY